MEFELLDHANVWCNAAIELDNLRLGRNLNFDGTCQVVANLAEKLAQTVVTDRCELTLLRVYNAGVGLLPSLITVLELVEAVEACILAPLEQICRQPELVLATQPENVIKFRKFCLEMSKIYSCEMSEQLSWRRKVA